MFAESDAVELPVQVAIADAETPYAAAPVLKMSYQPQFSFLSQNEGAAMRLAKAQRINAIEFSKVSYTRGNQQKLFKVSGKTRPGEVLTVMGPSMAGKTKLLAILAGSVMSSESSGQKLTGEFRADGQPMFKVLRAGFVARSDALFATATVEEELLFNARLRLPAEVSESDRQLLVQDIMRSLGLEGDAKKQFKKLSPSAKKRLAIGIELCICPNALFLDEPTSNLDPFAAWEIMRILNALAASKSCIVVCSVQNPPSSVFSELSNVLLLGQGRVLYHGHASDLNAAFKSVNLVCPPNYNPADFALLCARMLPLEKLPGEQQVVKNTTVVANGDSATGLQKQESVYPAVTESDVQLFQHRPRHRSALYEFQLLVKRELRATKRDPKILIGRIISTLVIMALCACVFLYAADTTLATYFVGSHFASFVFPLFSSSFGTIVPAVLYLFETKATFVRERAVNVYGTIPFLFARLLPELLINFFIALLTVLILYWAARWQGSFILLVVIFYLLYLSCVSWAYLLAFAVPNVGIATGLVPLVMVPQLLFMGTFVRIGNLPVWLSWISYICNTVYALRLVGVWELAPEHTNSPIIRAQWKFLNDSNYFYADDTWWYIVVLIAFFVVLRAVAFLIIRRKIASAKRFGEL